MLLFTPPWSQNTREECILVWCIVILSRVGACPRQSGLGRFGDDDPESLKSEPGVKKVPLEVSPSDVRAQHNHRNKQHLEHAKAELLSMTDLIIHSAQIWSTRSNVSMVMIPLGSFNVYTTLSEIVCGFGRVLAKYSLCSSRSKYFFN